MTIVERWRIKAIRYEGNDVFEITLSPECAPQFCTEEEAEDGGHWSAPCVHDGKAPLRYLTVERREAERFGAKVGQVVEVSIHVGDE